MISLSITQLQCPVHLVQKIDHISIHPLTNAYHPDLVLLLLFLELYHNLVAIPQIIRQGKHYSRRVQMVQFMIMQLKNVSQYLQILPNWPILLCNALQTQYGIQRNRYAQILSQILQPL